MKTNTTQLIAILLFLVVLAAICWYFSDIISHILLNVKSPNKNRNSGKIQHLYSANRNAVFSKLLNI